MAASRKSGGASVALALANVKRRSGAGWVTATIAKRRTGGAWVDIFTGLEVTVSPAVIEGSVPNGTEVITLTASSSGGSGGYTYSWAIVAGGAEASLSSTTGNPVTLSVTGTNVERQGTVRCTVTDSSAATDTFDVTYYLVFGSPV